MKENFIIENGSFLRSRSFSDSRNPFNNEVVSRLYFTPMKIFQTVSDVVKEINKKDIPELMGNLSSNLKKEFTSIAELTSMETGSPISFVKDDISESLDFLNKVVRIQNLVSDRFIKEPKGTILISIASNQPINSTINPLIPAIIGGNKVIIKPSSRAPSTPFNIIKMLLNSGFPKENISFLPFKHKNLEYVISLPQISSVYWTGGSKSARIAGSIALKHMKEFIPESEGNDWCFIDDKTNLERVVDTVFKSFITNNGCMCNSIRGALIKESVYDEFHSLLLQRLEKIKVGNPLEIDTDIGPLQKRELIDDLLIKIRLSGAETNDYYSKGNIMSPIIIKNPPLDSNLVEKGFFAPALWIRSVSNEKEVALIYKNHNNHGLDFTVFSDNEKTITFLQNKIKCGVFHINNNPLSISSFSPWGGCGLSGFGGAKDWSDKFLDNKYTIRGNI